MNLVARQIYGTKINIAPPIDLSVNTYIGGVFVSISTPSLLASKLAIDVSRISNFTVVGSDIKCKITGSYAIPASTFKFDVTPNCTYYYDNDGLVTSIGADGFYNQNGFLKIIANNLTVIGDRIFNACNLTEAIFPNLTNIENNSNLAYNNWLGLIYIPRVLTIGTSASVNNGAFTSIKSGVKIYAHPSLSTANGGGVEADLAYAISSLGASVVYVTNFTVPNAVTTLTSGTIYNTAVQLNFTPPSSTNTIEYYEYYVGGVFKDKITASGQYVLGLIASTSYVITVIAVDVFYNKSLVSNSLSVTTTNVASAVPTSGLKSYYKLDEITGTTANDSYSTEHLTNTGISINQNGLAGSSNKSTSTGQKLQTTSASPITGNFSINLWCYRTKNADLYSALLEYGTWNANDGFGIWVDNSNNVGWRINRTFVYSALMNLPLNVWTMITFTYDGSNIRLYKNSTLQVTTAHTTNPTTNSQKTLFFGHNGAMFYGNIDEACSYNRAITQTEINAFYNSGTGITL